MTSKMTKFARFKRTTHLINTVDKQIALIDRIMKACGIVIEGTLTADFEEKLVGLIREQRLLADEYRAEHP